MKRTLAFIVIAGALAYAAIASANVLVFTTDFNKRKDVSRLDRLAGGKKACEKSWKGKKALGAEVKVGRKNCMLQTPVEGDAKQPDHVLQASLKVSSKTSKKIRKQAYVGLALRANSKSSYEIRIFPKGRKYKLLKNGDAVDAGKNKAINELDKRNRLRFEAIKSDVTAKVNGKRLAKFKDNDPGEVNGRKTAITFGSEARSNKNGYMVFQSVKGFVPDP
jgi:hypothetical protein